jgi:hypothetical protein
MMQQSMGTKSDGGEGDAADEHCENISERKLLGCGTARDDKEPSNSAILDAIS